jgi:ribonuclease-3
MRQDQAISLQKRLGYHFKNKALLERALTHRSASKTHNERLEFLGDAILGMVVADILYNKFPNEGEGTLTRMRSSIVKGDTLAELAKELELGELIQLGSGELKSGGFRRSSILADVVEALIGAVYLDADLAESERLIHQWFGKRIEKLDPTYHPKDNKTQLQEYLQAKKLPLPVYTVENITGKAHQQQFEISCQISLLTEKILSSGTSRRLAEQQAAKIALEKIHSGNG